MKNLIPYHKFNEAFGVTEDTVVCGEPVSYWLNYEDGEKKIYADAPSFRIVQAIEHVLWQYETQDGELEDDDPQAFTAYRDEVIAACKELCEVFFNYQGYIDQGVISAYVMQNSHDTEAWQESPVLVDVNHKTGVFDN